MAIAFGDAIGTTILSTPTNTVSSPSVSGSDTIGIVMVQGAANDTNNVTAITWGLSAMTKIGQFRHSGERMQSLWYVVSPAAGVSTITFTAVFDILGVAAAYYTGAKQTGQPDSFATFDATTTTSVNATTTVVASDSWLVAGCSFSSGAVTGIDSTPGGPRGTPSDNGTYFDSDGTVATGSQSLAISWTNDSNAWGVVASITPAANTQLFTLLGVGT